MKLLPDHKPMSADEQLKLYEVRLLKSFNVPTELLSPPQNSNRAIVDVNLLVFEQMLERVRR